MKKLGPALLILFVLVLAYGLLREQEERNATSETEATQLVNLALQNATRVTIHRLNHEPATVVFEQRDGQWWLVEPMEYLADQVSLSGMVDQFDNKTYERAFKADDLAPFELDSAKLRVVWETGSGTETIHIGKTTPVDNNLYARRDTSSEVMVVAAGFTYNLEKELVDYRSKEVFWTSPGLVSSATFVTQEATWTITRRDGVWYAGDISLDTRKVNPLLTRIENMRVRAFLDDADSDSAEFAVQRQIRIQGADGQAALEFAGKIADKNTYRMRIVDRDQWVSISSPVYKGLWDTPEQLKYVPPVPPEPVSNVTEASE